MNKFWNWVRNEDTGAAELIFNGPISEDTWFGDEITPAMFRNELSKVSGDLTVWLNSPGGDVFAASQISVPFGWLFTVDNYIAVLHDCGSVSADDYYLAWKAVTDNTHPMIRTIKVLEVST